MKADIHPDYVVATVQCSCGNRFETRSTRPDLHVEICSECHPFYTGKQKLIDAGGRVERFQKRYAKQQEAQEKAKDTAKKRTSRAPAAEAAPSQPEPAAEPVAEPAADAEVSAPADA